MGAHTYYPVLPESRIHARIPASPENLTQLKKKKRGGGGGHSSQCRGRGGVHCDPTSYTGQTILTSKKKEEKKRKEKGLARILAQILSTQILPEYCPNCARISYIGQLF